MKKNQEKELNGKARERRLDTVVSKSYKNS